MGVQKLCLDCFRRVSSRTLNSVVMGLFRAVIWFWDPNVFFLYILQGSLQRCYAVV